MDTHQAEPAEVIKLWSMIERLYEMPYGKSGGTLHLLLDDFNVDPDGDVTPTEVKPEYASHYPPELVELCDGIARLLRGIPPEDQLGIVRGPLAQFESCSEHPARPVVCRFSRAMDEFSGYDANGCIECCEKLMTDPGDWLWDDDKIIGTAFRKDGTRVI